MSGNVYAANSTDKVGTTDPSCTQTQQLARASEAAKDKVAAEAAEKEGVDGVIFVNDNQTEDEAQDAKAQVEADGKDD